jgi:hypothetical protein
MHTSCVRQGQATFGVIENEFVVKGRVVTAYTLLRHGEITLVNWKGQSLGCRSEIVERFADGSLAILFRLGHERFLAGYAFGDDGMLFRGELVEDSEAEARWVVRIVSDQFAAVDAEDADTNATFATGE